MEFEYKVVHEAGDAGEVVLNFLDSLKLLILLYSQRCKYCTIKNNFKIYP